MREHANRFLAEKCGSEVPRRVLESEELAFDAELWQQMAEMGWTGVTVPEEFGGSGIGHLAACVLAEEIGYRLAPVPFSSVVYLGIEALLLYGSSEQKQSYLPALARGETLITFAAAEKPGAFDENALSCQYVDGRLRGVKVAVADGNSAALAIVAARPGAVSNPSPSHSTAQSSASTADNPSAWLYLVELNQAGVTRETTKCIDPSRPQTRIEFDAVSAHPLAAANDSSAIRHLLNRAAIMMAFEQLGAAQAALDMAKEYAKERFAFGRPIGSFQAIKHKLADVYVNVELARSNAYYGAWALHTAAAELPLAAAVARVAASEAGWQAAKENIQTHGGMGYTWQGNCHMNYRRAALLGLSLGGSGEWKRRLTGELQRNNQAVG